MGVAAYLTNPFNRDELYKAIVAVLSPENSEEERGKKLVTRHLINEKELIDKKILLAEDYIANQRVALAHLRGQGFQVALAENGQEAVDLFKKNHYDLVLMDINMPVLDGIEATKLIRQHEQQRAVKLPILAMTANAMAGDREKYLAVGMNDYVSKPFKKKEMLDTVKKWLAAGAVPDAKLDVEPKKLDQSDPELPSDKVMMLLAGHETGPPLAAAPSQQLPVVVDRELEDIVPLFMAQTEKDIKLMFEAVNTKNSETLRITAHSLKGAGGSYDMPLITELAAEVEQAAKENNLDKAEQNLKKLNNYFNHLEIFFE